MSFQELQLAAPLLRAIDACGYTTPTPVQAGSIPEVLAGRDLIASAQTGTGKTAAFMLPVLHKLLDFKKNPKGAPRVLVLTPTRELAAQVTEATRTYGKFMRVSSTVILGGMSYQPQFRDLSRPIDLVVGTPGRLIDHLERGSLDLSRLEVLILDEADRMLDMGFKEDVERITAKAPAERQTLLFTATMDKTMTQLAGRLLNDPVRVEIAGRKVTLDQIAQRLYVADNLGHKNRLLKRLLETEEINQAIVFAATKRASDDLARDLASQGHQAAALHGDMSQAMRNRTLQNLRRGRIRVLVATDVAARGIDVAGISHVINFDLPQSAEDYVHRIGRTGRAGASGTAISFVSGTDALRLRQIENYIHQTLPQELVPGLEPTRPLQSQHKKPANARNNKRHGSAAKGRYQGNKKSSANGGKEPVVEYRSRKAGRRKPSSKSLSR